MAAAGMWAPGHVAPGITWRWHVLNAVFRVHGIRAALIVAAMISPCTLGAQTSHQPLVSQSAELVAVPVSALVPATPVAMAPTSRAELGPRITAVAFHESQRAPLVVQSSAIASAPEGPHGGLGTDLALVGVGAVGTFAGIKIGGAVGGTIAVAGAAVALYGLYKFLQ